MSLRVLSLFAGAGGLDLGLRQAGHNLVWANDFDKDSCETYRKNIDTNIHHGDVAEFDARKLPDHDILVGGFPCQGFSRANINRVDGDQRNNLYRHVIRFLTDKTPPFFLLENVKGIISLNSGRDFAEILSCLEECHYEVCYSVLNAADFGVPQNRKRVFIFGVRRDCVSANSFQFPLPTHSKDGDLILKKWKSIGVALAEIEDDLKNENCSNHVYSRYKVVNRDFTGHRRTDPDKPSPTILARGNGGGGVCAIPHPNNKRRLSVRESAYIQTFPMDFEFVGSLSSMYRQIGNAVPVLLGKAMGERLRTL
jgi:DNA (cytosine-5)-methyltransferase 1|tara:strand:+ start:2330 stop:3259 length:930 start_codon:yes stop_codon:yes gene_type:complete